MPGKKWCEYCRINLPFDKKAIQQHQSTRMHMQNKQTHIKYQRLKIIKEQKQSKESAKKNQLISTANIPKAQRGSQLQKQVNQYKNDVIMNGKMAINQLIAEKTQGLYGAPIAYPQKQELLIAENYIEDKQKQGIQDQEQDYEMWKIDICQKTGAPCFINRITKMKLYEPPKGYVLSEQQKQQWQQIQKICEQMPLQNQQQYGEAGLWEEVEDEVDYFQANKIQQSNSQEQYEKQKARQDVKIEYSVKKQEIKQQEPQKEQKKKSWMQNLRQQIHNNQVNQSQVFDSMVNNTLNECRNTKQKNDTLKKLIKHDIEIHRKFDNLLQKELEQQEANSNKKTIVSLKPKKKVKTAKLTSEKDII